MTNIEQLRNEIKQDAHDALEVAMKESNPDVVTGCKSHINSCIGTLKALQRYQWSCERVQDLCTKKRAPNPDADEPLQRVY